MALWMIHSVLVSGLLLGAAWAVERALTLYSRPVRLVWAGLMLGAVLLPAGALLFPSGLPSTAPVSGTYGPASTVSVIAEGIGSRAEGAGLNVDLLLGVGWVLVSTTLLVRIAVSRIELGSKLQRAARREVGAATLYLTSGLGPAVTGIGGGQVVLPRWLWRLGPRMRRLAIAHEREHVRTGDHWLLTGAHLLVVLLPWNLPLWWGLHQLRLAVETDCDRRVLRNGADPRTYGELLLHVGERRSTRIPGFAALMERTSYLERRIGKMTRSRPTYRGAKALVAAAVAVVAILAACESPSPAEESAGITGDASGPAANLTSSSEVSEGCEGDCNLRLANQFEDQAVEIYVHEKKLGEYMGDVQPGQTAVFELRNRKWPHVQLSVREAGTHRFISLECVRQFNGKEARAVIEDPTSREKC